LPVEPDGIDAMHQPVRPLRPFIDFEVSLDPREWRADVAVIGIAHSEPYPGEEQPNDQSRAPDAIRHASELFSFGGRDHYDFDFGTDLAALLPRRCIDCGNLLRTEPSYDEYSARVTAALATLWRGGAQVIVLGGDHGVTIPVLDALEVLERRVHVVHIDAHLDWRRDVSGVRRGYSSPLYWASTKRCVAGMTQIGLRGTGSARRAEVAAARAYGSRLFTAAEVHAGGLGPVLGSIPSDLPLYVTIDADGLDPTVMPGVMAPAPGGLTFTEVAPLLASLARRQPVVGMDIVEIAPRYDSSNAITCITAGRLIATLLGNACVARAAAGTGKREAAGVAG
jgi:agmatinase